MINSQHEVTILGAGVSGVTTGIVLQLLGYRTNIIAKDRADHPRNPGDPSFASLYPSASIIPHSVFGDHILYYFRDSHAIFELLLDQKAAGLSINRHYEVFEYPKPTPTYTSVMNNFCPLSDDWQSDPYVPHRSQKENLYGWSFDCLFADWPVYMPQLFDWYQALGGSITMKEIQPDEVKNLPSPLINCTGLAGRVLFDNTEGNVVLKGELVHILEASDIQNDLGQTLSYNYNPKTGIYSDTEGNRQDLYCYPRSDGWLIGGSRLKGTVDANGHWEGIPTGSTKTKVDGVSVPSAIIDINRNILLHSYGIEMDRYPNRTAFSGYRYIRDQEKGLHVEKEKDERGLTIHNYGHGGAGVTLSWGTAVQVAVLLRGELDCTPKANLPTPEFEKLQSKLLELSFK